MMVGIEVGRHNSDVPGAIDLRAPSRDQAAFGRPKLGGVEVYAYAQRGTLPKTLDRVRNAGAMHEQRG